MRASSATIRAGIAALVVAMLLAGAWESFYLRMWRTDRAKLGRMLTELPYRKMAGSRELFLETRRVTKQGDKIALLVPMRQWYNGYDYAFGRASYVLSGRILVPLLSQQNEPLPQNLSKADYLLSWHVDAVPAGFAPLIQTPHGRLLRRSR